MIETQLVFRNEYRFDLKKVNSVLIPYLFEENVTTLIINVDAISSKNYRSVGRVDQIAIDFPSKLVASSQVVRFGNQALYFQKSGRFKLEFYPNYYLGKTRVTLQKVIDAKAELQVIDNKLDEVIKWNRLA